MKNPMTPEQQCQVIMDEKSGFDIEIRPLGTEEWSHKVYLGNFNFRDNEYRSKPEPVECFANIYINNEKHFHHSLKMAQRKRDPDGFLATIRLVEDTTWKEPEPEEKNPWQPIVQGEWPECGPLDEIICRDKDGRTWTNRAGNQGWNRPLAIEWKYEEDGTN